MHELPATQGILETALEAAQRAGGRRILAIDLVIGELTSIVDDSVQFYFDVLSRGTLAEAAVLRVRREPAELTCNSCGLQAPVTPPLPFTCPACDALTLRVEGGQSFHVESIEVDDASTGDPADPEGEPPGRSRERETVPDGRRARGERHGVAGRGQDVADPAGA